MSTGKTICIAVAVTGLMAWHGERVSAQEEQAQIEPSIQSQSPDQAQAAGRTRRGYPGYRVRKLDEMQKMPREQQQKNRIKLLVEDEREQLKKLNEDRELSIEQKREKARQIREATHDKIKVLLPPDEQKKLDTSRENERRFREALRRKGGEISVKNQ